MVPTPHRIDARAPRRTLASSSVAIGPAATFVLSAALLSLVVDRQQVAHQSTHRRTVQQGHDVRRPNRTLVLGDGWDLRGTLAPTDQPFLPMPVPPRRLQTPVTA